MSSAVSGYSPVTGSCEHVNESSGPIKSEEFLDQFRDRASHVAFSME
jgi:hypothetical protein